MAETSEPLRAAGVIACSKFGRILMVRRTDGEGWAFPGGGIKEGESPAQAAYREFWEETGYRLGRLGKLQMRRVKDGVDFSTFLASVDDEFVPTLNHEHDAWAWVDPMTTLDEAKFSSAMAPAMQMPVYADDAKADDWKEEDHPRGQPGNAGQFGSGGGGSGGGSESPKSEKPASEAPKGGREITVTTPSPPSGKSAPVQSKSGSDWDEDDLDIKRMAAKLAPASGKSVEGMAAKLAPLPKPSAERKAQVSKATKKFFATSAIAAVLSTVSKDAVAHTLNAAQMKAVETIGEKVTDVVTEGLEWALGLGAAALGAHLGHGLLGHDVVTSTAVVGLGGFAARYAVSMLVEKIGIGEEGLGRKLLTKACKAIVAKFGKGKAETLEGTGDDADEPDYGDEDVLAAITLLLKGLEGDAKAKADSARADLFDESKVKRGQPENAGQFGSGGGGKKPEVSEGKTHSGGEEFVSPSVEQGMNFSAAQTALHSPRQKAMLKTGDEIDKALGLEESSKSVIGAWSDGAENSVLAELPDATWDEIKVSAAMKGYVGDQKAVLAFKQDDAGTATMYSMDVKGDLDDIHERLLADGLPFHSLAPTEGGASVYVADLDGSSFEGIQKAAEDFDAKATFQRGNAEFLGTTKEDGDDRAIRDDARRAYEDIIRESPLPDAQGIWGRNRDRWTEAVEGHAAGGGEAEDDGLEQRADSGAWNPGSDEEELNEAALDAIADAIERLDARISRMDMAFADKAEFKEEWVKRGGHTDNPGKFSEQGGPGKVVEPAETHEPVEKFKEPPKEPSPGGKALKEANQPVSPEAHEKNLKAAKASGDLAKVEQEKALDKQHDQQLELVAAKGDPKAAAAKVAGKKPSKLGDAPEELNKEALSPDRLNEMSALPLFEGAGVPIKGSVTRKGGEVVSEGNYEPGDRTITEVADDLVQRGQAWLRDLGYPNGRVDSSNATPEVNDALATVIAEETKRALDAAKQENPERSAANWYNTALDEAMNVAALTHPEIKTDPKAKTAFSAAMAITSQDETVFSNARLADQAYESWKKNGKRFRMKKEDFKASKQKMMLNNFAKYDALMDTFGDEAGKAFLENEISVEKYMQALKGPLKLKGPPTGFGMKSESNSKMYGSALFGPKIGNGFFQNLIGNFEPVTQDKWFLRTFGRMTGTLRDVKKSGEAENELRGKFTDLLKQGDKANKIAPRTAASSPAELDQQAMQVFREAEDDYKKNGKAYQAKTKTRPKLYAAALRMKDMIKGIREDPGTPDDRKWRGEIVAKARDKLKAEGIDLSNADLQATIWYPEKTLWKRMGSKGPNGGNADYSDAFQLLAMKKGRDSADIERITGRKVKSNLADLEAAATPEGDDESDDGLGEAAE